MSSKNNECYATMRKLKGGINGYLCVLKINIYIYIYNFSTQGENVKVGQRREIIICKKQVLFAKG